MNYNANSQTFHSPSRGTTFEIIDQCKLEIGDTLEPGDVEKLTSGYSACCATMLVAPKRLYDVILNWPDEHCNGLSLHQSFTAPKNIIFVVEPISRK